MTYPRRRFEASEVFVRGVTVLGLAILLVAPSCRAQSPAKASAAAAPAATAAPIVPIDAGLVAAEDLVGKALFLRGFYMANVLGYDATGKIEGSPRTGDWTLAAVNVTKAERIGPEAIQLDGVRVAIRYNPDAHEFQRHPLNDEKMRLVVKEPAGDTNARQLRAAFAAIFSIGIDPALERSTQPAWQHYFDPSAAWPVDALVGQAVYPMFGQPDQPKDVTPPVPAHKAEAQFTPFAEHDRVKGPVQLRMIVDENGIPRRIAVTRPLGYGLDEKAAEAMEKWRFTPAQRAGKPVPAAIVVNLDFEYVAPPR